MARRYLAGSGQLLLALIGFGLILAWFLSLMSEIYKAINSEVTPRSVAWIGELGAVFFGAAWLWSLVTSLSLIREARANEPPPELLS
jgi:hypothetical protein